MKKSCMKCKKNKDCILVRVNKTLDPLCLVCFNSWVDERDRAVSAAYGKWIKLK
jgi:hypothetical protein